MQECYRQNQVKSPKQMHSVAKKRPRSSRCFFLPVIYDVGYKRIGIWDFYLGCLEVAIMRPHQFP